MKSSLLLSFEIKEVRILELKIEFSPFKIESKEILYIKQFQSKKWSESKIYISYSKKHIF